jgi:hypothetical protein
MSASQRSWFPRRFPGCWKSSPSAELGGSTFLAPQPKVSAFPPERQAAGIGMRLWVFLMEAARHFAKLANKSTVRANSRRNTGSAPEIVRIAIDVSAGKKSSVW